MTISSAQCHPTVPEYVSFYSAWEGKEVYYYCLFLFAALKKVSCTLMFF